MQIASVYLHIPFCLRKCYYCDFASLPLAGREEDLAAYPALLQAELGLWRNEIDFRGLRTVYFGGGTPSLLAPEQVRTLLALFPPVEEATLEANPETLDAERLRAFHTAGVNRLSLGAQSFDDRLLRAMGRGHSADETGRAVGLARAAGFANLGVDLIYGLPGQTLAQWRNDLEQALALSCEHISLYGLTLHAGTEWGERAERGGLAAADQDSSADMLELAIRKLKQVGYRHYEISNFARPGFESRHNLAYWRRENYLGLGVAAASCLANSRFGNTQDLAAYAVQVGRGERPIAEAEELDIDQVLAEAVFLGLRLSEGICFADFARQYGLDPRRRFAKQIARLVKYGLLVADEERMYLSPRGLMLGNEAFAEFV